jgi:nitroreductase
MDTSELLTALNWRYATKVFDSSKKIPADTWAALEESLVLTPSSFGLQPWKFFIIQDQELREKLVAHTWRQRQVADCSHLVVMTVKKPTASTISMPSSPAWSRCAVAAPMHWPDSARWSRARRLKAT